MNYSDVFIALGSNLGDRVGAIKRAVESMTLFIEDIAVSSLYETAPMYVEAQPAFLNAVLKGVTLLSPGALLNELQDVELRLGRDRGSFVNKGPRVIDLDILLYSDLVMNTQYLTIPHPGIKERRFVLEPLLELDKNVLDPKEKVRYSTYLRKNAGQDVRPFNN